MSPKAGAREVTLAGPLEIWARYGRDRKEVQGDLGEMQGINTGDIREIYGRCTGDIREIWGGTPRSR